MKIQALRRSTAIAIVLFLIAAIGFEATSFAETDVTEKVELVQSAMVFDRRTSQYSLDVSVKNISQDVLLTPIKIVVDTVNPADVTVANADGATNKGKSYYQLDVSDLSDGQLDIDESVSKKIVFNNSLRKRFTFVLKATASLPTPEVTIKRATEALGNKNKDDFFVNLSESESRYFQKKYDTIPEGAFNYLAQIIKSGTLVEGNSQHRKYEALITLPNNEVVTTKFSMVFENGAWRLAEL